MKIVFELNNSKYILDPEDAEKILEMLAKAEIYEQQYHRAENGNPSYYTNHVYEQTETEPVKLTAMSNSLYAMYKMAGKPNSDY